MRQRLSSEPDRYRGRRRVPTPPRSRYAAVVTTAFVGAGVVALGADDAARRQGRRPDGPGRPAGRRGHRRRRRGPRRPGRADRASRDTDRQPGSETTLAETADVWLLPLQDYTFTSPYGMRWGKLHAGIDLAAAEGTPFVAVHAGTVKPGRLGRRLRLRDRDRPRPTASRPSTATAAASRQGRRVKAGQPIGLVGSHGPRVRLAPAPRDTCQRPAERPGVATSASTEWTSSYKSHQSTAE